MGTGIVEIRNLRLESGVVLENLQLAYERVGGQDAPVVLVCHALTGCYETVGTDEKLGCWSGLAGQGKSIDTNKFSVISFNMLGGCEGTTGLLCRNTFPEVTIRDMVHAERKALTALGINRLHTIIGGSQGGIRVLEWGILYADDMDILIPVVAVTWSPSAHCAIKAKVVALAFTHDLINPPEEVRAFVHNIPNSTYILVNTKCGHTGFLMELEKWGLIIKQYMEVTTCRQSKSLYWASVL